MWVPQMDKVDRTEMVVLSVGVDAAAVDLPFEVVVVVDFWPLHQVEVDRQDSFSHQLLNPYQNRIRNSLRMPILRTRMPILLFQRTRL